MTAGFKSGVGRGGGGGRGKLTVAEERNESRGGARELGLDLDANAGVPMGK